MRFWQIEDSLCMASRVGFAEQAQLEVSAFGKQTPQFTPFVLKMINDLAGVKSCNKQTKPEYER